jgi:acetoin utilization deacetylase AcuC-like enzyme
VAERRTGLVYDERCVAHDPPGGDPPGQLPPWAAVPAFERPERLTLTRRAFEGSGVLGSVVELAPRFATADELLLAHSEEHVLRVLEAAASGERVELGEEAWTGPGTHDALLLAAGGTLTAVEAVLDRTVDNAFAVLRPPGHHAGRDLAMGFCLVNNVAIAARWAQRVRGVERVAIVDWDVHHGNGTEAIFLGDASVLTVSLHQDGLYPPDSGGLDATAPGDTVNVPLPAGTGDAGYALAFDSVVAPAVRAFRPDLLLVAAGQDTSATDPLGRMAITVPGFRSLAERAVALAEELCGGRLVAVLEGGYSLLHLPLANLAILEGLAGLPPSFAHDPTGIDVSGGLRDAERDAVAAAERVALD